MQYGNINGKEHDSLTIDAKRVKGYAWNPDTLEWVRLDARAQNLPDETILEFDSLSTVAGNSIVTLVTHTAVGTTWVDGYVGTGTVDAEYSLYIDANLKMVTRTAEQDRTSTLFFPVPVKVLNGSIVTLKVVHYREFTADFDGTIVGHKFV